MTEFQKRLKSLRDRRGLKRYVASERCGFSSDLIGKYERGELEPTMNKLIALADFFEVSMDYLCGRTDNKRGPL